MDDMPEVILNMCKKIVSLTVTFLLLLSLTFSIPVMEVVKATPAEIIVPDDHEKIQWAIGNASDGDTIRVKAGTYYENVVVNKTVSLIGENPATTIIDGSERKTVVRIKASNVEIRNFTIQNGGDPPYSGLFVGNCNGSTISNNIIRNSAYGIELFNSNGSRIIGNTIMNNSWAGIYIHDSNENIIHGNTIANNSIGVWIPSSAVPNTFYHNNFINNPTQAVVPAFTKWDNGAEGNYWSDYTGDDLNGDGIGDTPYPEPISPWDGYPLMEPWSLFRVFDIFQNEEHYYVIIYCNSTVGHRKGGVSFLFSQPEKQIRFNVTGPSGTLSFCNVTIPQTLLNATPPEWLVLFDGTNKTDDVDINWNATHTFFDFNYTHSTHRVQIIGTEVISNGPPIANFTYSPLNPTVLDFINFTDTSTDPDGSIIKRFWDFGDGNNWTDPGLNPTRFHKYEKRGTYNVTLTVTDSVQATNATTKTITVVNAPPTANFTYSPTVPKVNQTVRFTDASTDPEESIVAWLWEFGDDTNSTERDPTHKYSEEGTYNVTLTIEDDENATDTMLKTITVSKVGTEITFDAPPTTVGETINVTAVLKDEDGNPVSDETIDFYLYDDGVWKKFDDAPTDATGFASVTYTPTIAGEYLMRAVYNGSIIYAGNSSTATLVVNMIATTLSVYVPSTASVRETIIITASLKDEDGNPVSDETIDFYLYDDGVWKIFNSTLTNATGFASVTYTPAIKGEHQIMAIYNGSMKYVEKNSTATIMVNPLVVTLTIDAPDPLTLTLGKSITITAILKDENGDPFLNVTINFYLLEEGTWKTIGSSETDSNGIAVIKYTPPATGTFHIKAEFPGTQTYGLSSYVITLKVRFDYTPYIIGGVAIAAIAGVIAFIVLKKRKKVTPPSKRKE